MRSAPARRLAAEITARDEPAIASFLALAAEFEAKAVEAGMREKEAETPLATTSSADASD